MDCDEQLADNPFFNQLLQKQCHEQIKDCWNSTRHVIVVPLASSLPSRRLYKSLQYVQAHVLSLAQNDDDGHTKWASISGWEATLSHKDKTLETGQGYPVSGIRVKVVYEENYYSEDFDTLKVFVVARGLFRTHKDSLSTHQIMQIRLVKVSLRNVSQHNMIIQHVFGPESLSHLAQQMHDFYRKIHEATTKRQLKLTLQEDMFRIETEAFGFINREQKRCKKHIEDNRLYREVVVSILFVYLEYTPLSTLLFNTHLRQHPMENQRIKDKLDELKDVTMEDVGVPRHLCHYPRKPIELVSSLNKETSAIKKILLIQVGQTNR